MTEKIGFFTPVQFSAAQKSFKQKISEGFDNYFYLGGRRARVIPGKEINGSLGVSVNKNSKMGGGEVLLCALKVVSYFTGIIPLIMLIAKAASRSSYKFHITTEPSSKSASKVKTQKKKHLMSSKAPKKIKKVVLDTPKEESKFYTIEANRRPGKMHIPVRIKIANLKKHKLKLKESNLGSIFGLANKYTCNAEYAIQKNSIMIDGKLVHRPNHNGTHGARQVKYLEGLFDFIEFKGSEEAYAALTGLSQEEKMSLKLGAYFLRAGRVDESSHKNPPADDYYTRSALIYEEYAKQLGTSPKTIEWVKKLIINSCKPHGVREKDIETSSKNWFGYQVFTFVHEMDLIRCYPKGKIDHGVFPKMQQRLGYFAENKSSLAMGNYINEWLEFAKDVCDSTGVMRKYDHAKGDSQLFAQCSTEGRTCWNKVKAVNIPVWSS